MAFTNDSMFTKLAALYPSEGATLGDRLRRFWVDRGLENSGTLQEAYFRAAGATGGTFGDVANDYWTSFGLSRLLQESGLGLLVESGGNILLEAGN